MSTPLVLSENARFCLRCSDDELLGRAQPFILKCSEYLEETKDLEESVLRTAEAFPDAARLFVIEPGGIAETFGLRDDLLFRNPEPWMLIVESGSRPWKVDLSGRGGQLPSLQRLMELCSSGTHEKSRIEALIGGASRLFERFVSDGIAVEKRHECPAFASPGVPGVYRLQHACLLYRSATSGILVDPHLHSTYGAGIASDFYRDTLEGKVDAILISHSHGDHWSLSTLMMFPRETPIVVPKVPAPTIVCPDMKALLESFGFTNVIAVDWYSAPLRLGDFEVHVLPFYGEQALRFDRPKHPAIRNWGNTYAVQTSDYTSWFLIDSGDDALGCMTEVAERVRRTIGKVDFVLSNLGQFYIKSPLYINCGLNWLTLSPRHICDLRSMRDHVVTLGPAGVARVCEIAGARFYLPYAHWWGEPGCTGTGASDIPGQSEADLLVELAALLANGDTRIVPWNIGDGFIPSVGAGFCHAPLQTAR